MAIVYANLGSNLGNRREIIEKALDCIGEKFGYYCKSGFVDSMPWGFESANPFLNIGVAFKSDLHPEQILDELQTIEKRLSKVAHRDINGNYKDREIDIDIMAIDDITYNSDRLIIPHPHIYERDFFYIPLEELRGKRDVKNN